MVSVSVRSLSKGMETGGLPRAGGSQGRVATKGLWLRVNKTSLARGIGR